MGAFFGAVFYLQYWSPTLLGSANLQATHRTEILTANPATAFPYARWSTQVGTALLTHIPELSFRMGGIAFSPDSIQAFSLLLQQWSFDKLSQWEAGAGYLLHLFQHKVLVAVRGRLLATDFSEYGRLFRFTPDIGLQALLSPKLTLGGYAYNLLGRGWGHLPVSPQYGLGLRYAPSAHAQLAVEVTQQGKVAPVLHTTFLYAPVAFLQLRGGVAVPNFLIGGGVGLRYKKAVVEAGFQYQPMVGSIAAIGLKVP